MTDAFCVVALVLLAVLCLLLDPSVKRRRRNIP